MTSTHFPKMVDTGHTLASLRFLLCLGIFGLAVGENSENGCDSDHLSTLQTLLQSQEDQREWLVVYSFWLPDDLEWYGCVITVEMERERERGREKRLYIFNRIRNISSDCFEQRFSWTCILNNRYMFFPAVIFVRIDGRACWMIHMQHVQYARQTTLDWSHGHIAGKYTHICHCPLFSMVEDMC